VVALDYNSNWQSLIETPLCA